MTDPSEILPGSRHKRPNSLSHTSKPTRTKPNPPSPTLSSHVTPQPSISEAQQAVPRRHTEASFQSRLDAFGRELSAIAPLTDSIRSIISRRQAADGIDLEKPLLSLLTSLVQLHNEDPDSTRTLIKNIDRAFTDGGDALLNLFRLCRDGELEAFDQFRTSSKEQLVEAWTKAQRGKWNS